MTSQTEDFSSDDAAFISFVIRFDPVAEERYEDSDEEFERFLEFFGRAPDGNEIDQVVLQ
ncbi:hypothetical protein NR402_11955 [Acidithiobacillus ferrooxidans]|jgi:hypothetical protein|uniref:hypothetical protein n=1 Tax=Acidithiobacillus ferrooxidans TaxID=920 RepID=UPI00214B54AF|nr:hypothetical protein [Acidithiobacillus ferrooxidans]MCR2830988.1 hypothetical protein [Acidithiobacillus ferrooxidans]